MVLVDTPIWSIAYRRTKRTSREQRIFDDWCNLVRVQGAVLIGPVRQEVLSGFSSAERYGVLRMTLRAFEDLPVDIADYELAAHFHNDCRRRGVQGSPTDFLICAVAKRMDSPVFTTDSDFKRYAKFTDVRLYDSTRA